MLRLTGTMSTNQGPRAWQHRQAHRQDDQYRVATLVPFRRMIGLEIAHWPRERFPSWGQARSAHTAARWPNRAT